MSLLTKLLDSGNYITVNKYLIKKIGLSEAVLICYFISKHNYFKNNIKKKMVDNWFYDNQKSIQDNTGLTPYQQRSVIKKFIGLKLIEVESRGLPKKNYYRINETEIMNLIDNNKSNNLIASSKETLPMDVKKLDDINNNIKEIILKNKDISSDKSDNSPPVFENPIKPKKQDKKEVDKIYTHTWNDWVKIYDRLHKGTGGGLINWKAEVRAYKDIINMLSPEITETMPLITLLFQIYQYALKNKFVKETKLDLTPNRLIKFISDVTKENNLRDHYELLRYDKDYESFCEYFMSPEEKVRFDVGEVKNG